MRRPSDYWFEMFTATVSEQEIERLLTGSPAGNGALSDLAVFVEQMRHFASYVPSDQLVGRIAAEAASLALASRPTGVTGSKVSPPTRRRLPTLSPRVAVAALSVVMAVGMTGVAAAADSAAPGDPLYGLDRALERIGIGAGSGEERLEEANQLLAEGLAVQALEHAAEAVDGDAAASAALDIAIDEVETAATENSAAAQEKVDALLAYMSENIGKDNGVDGRDFGQGIADIARGIAPASESGDQAPADSPAPVNQNQPDDGERPGNSNQGTGSGNSDPPGSGGNQDNGNSGDADNPGTGSNQGGGNADPPGNSGASGGGNGPPSDPPSVTAPGRGNRP